MTRIRNRAVAAAATALLTSLALTAGAGAALASDSHGDDGPYSSDLLGAMQRDLGLGEQEARELLDAQAAAAERSLAAELGDAYAGAWFDQHDRTLHVGVTDRSKDDLVRHHGALPFHGEVPSWVLDRWLARLDETIDPTTVGSYYVDVANNRIVLEYLSGHLDQVKHDVRRARMPHNAVEYVEVTELPKPAIDVIGGNPYFINASSRCSVGFPVTGDAFITAGHCGAVGATTTNPNGTFTQSVFPGDDYALVSVAAANTLIGTVNNYRNYSVNVAGDTPAAAGAAVCRAGATTGWRCGVLESLNTTVNYPQGPVYGLLRTTACAEPGDSGGPLMAGNIAQGVTSGVSGNCTAGGVSFYQPVQEILAATGTSLLLRSRIGVETACSGSVRTLSSTVATAGATISTGALNASRIGFAMGCLDGPDGANFDLILQRQNADATWSTVATAASTAPVEYLTAPVTPGAYRWQVRATSGAGAFTLGYMVP